MKPDAQKPTDFLLLIETGLLLLLGFGHLVNVPDLTPLVRHFFGLRFGQPDFAMADPLYPLLRGLIGLTVLAYLLRSLLHLHGRGGPERLGLFQRSTSDPVRTALLWLLIVLAVGPGVTRDMFLRAVVDEAPESSAPFTSRSHDGGVLQLEEAVRALRRGENPYAADYSQTVMARAQDSSPAGWRMLGYEYNPAFDHIPYPPALIVASIVPMAAGEALLGWYDQRLFYLAAFFLFVWCSGRLVASGPPRRLVWMLTGLGPLLHPFLVIGRNDVVLLACLSLLALSLEKKRMLPAGLALGLACATKQFAWALVPLFVLLVWRQPAFGGRPLRRALLPSALVFSALVVPFLLWSPSAFFEDVVAFNLGFTDDAYPLRPDSLGFASFVLGMGWTNTLRHGFPMWLFQLAITLPLTVLLCWRLARRPTAMLFWSSGALITFTSLFFSAFFSISYYVVPTVMLLFAGISAAQARQPPAADRLSCPPTE